MTLGQGYLEHLMDTPIVGDNLIFLAAAYNAGPGSVSSWQHSLHYNDDPLLFVESIPCAESREYVLRVIGNYWIYSELLGRDRLSSAEALSQGKWARYEGSDEQLALMLSRLNTRVE
jgi:soluble lytic murein transglycosylase-like protein